MAKPRFILLLAVLAALPGLMLCVGAAQAQSWPAVRGNYGAAPCPQGTGNGDGCSSGAAIRVPNFFTGYAEQSVGASFPAVNLWGNLWNPATSVQPAIYAVRPPWNVAGVDYAVGMPRWQMPTLSNLSGQPWLKDPALVASDPLVNPNRDGANCRFYASNAAYPGGVGVGTTASPFPAPFGGPFIFCHNSAGSTNQLIFDSYHFGWNSVTGFNCVPLYIYPDAWGSGAAGTSAATAHIIIRNSLLLNGPNCNIWGGINQGAGTASAGPLNSTSVFMIQMAASAGYPSNSFALTNNTVFGCGGDANASALETALCGATFNATSYNAGPVTGFVSGATVGVAPMNAALFEDSQSGAGGNSWLLGNAFLHLPGRILNYNTTGVGNSTHVWKNNYIEGMLYAPQPYANVIGIVNSGGSQETVTTATPHGIPVGGYYSMVLSGNGASGYPAGWSLVTSVKATDATHFVFDNPANAGDWTWGGSGNQALAYANYAHGEATIFASNTAGASFTGAINGTTLTVSGLSGTLAVGQYVTAASGSGLSIPSPTYIVAGSGATWTLNQAPGNMSGAMVSPYYTGTVTFNYSYNTFLQTASTWGYGNTTVLYLSGVTQNSGVPLTNFTGSVDHNVFVDNLTHNGHGVPFANGVLSLAYSSFNSLALTNNYIDPTGAGLCWASIKEDPSTGLTMAGNVNLLNTADPYINQLDYYSVVPIIPGTASDTQAESGIAYNPTTGVVTLTLSTPAPISVGQQFFLSGEGVTTGTNYLAGNQTATSVKGGVVTFNAGTGYTGVPTGSAVTLSLYAPGGTTKQEQCYGHN